MGHFDWFFFGIYYSVYTIRWEDGSCKPRKVFQNGRSQAIRFPRDLRVDSAEMCLQLTYRDCFNCVWIVTGTLDPAEGTGAAEQGVGYAG